MLQAQQTIGCIGTARSVPLLVCRVAPSIALHWVLRCMARSFLSVGYVPHGAAQRVCDVRRICHGRCCRGTASMSGLSPTVPSQAMHWRACAFSRRTRVCMCVCVCLCMHTDLCGSPGCCDTEVACILSPVGGSRFHLVPLGPQLNLNPAPPLVHAHRH
jgi:hypothetical protein